MRRLLVMTGLELYAILIAILRFLPGVRTDEAKYLLNIPYPHPPLVRWILGWTEWLPYQDLFWRLLFATLMVQAVLMVWDLGRGISREGQVTLSGLWLFAAGVILQTGTIMMAPLTALQGLLWVWLLFRVRSVRVRHRGAWLGVFWLVCLFTAYQAILYIPIVIAVLYQLRLSRRVIALYVGLPIVLVVLYTATNPLAIASFYDAGTQNASSMTFTQSLGSAVWLWLKGGSIVLSVIGVAGAIRVRSWPLLLSFLLLIAFVTVSLRDYYAVLFVPVLIGGVAAAPGVLQRPSLAMALQMVMAAYFVVHAPLQVELFPSRAVMQELNSRLDSESIVLVNGAFGHQWQYESAHPVRHYRSRLLSRADAAVCLDPCEGVKRYGWKQLTEMPVNVWVRE